MKSVIAFVSACALALTGIAASPSFQSFNTNQFDTNGLNVAIKPASLQSNSVFISGTTAPRMVVTNENNTNLIVSFSSLSNGAVIIMFGNTPNTDTYGSIFINPSHDGSPLTPANVEWQFSTPGGYAFGPGYGVGGQGHWQWGIGLGDYWHYAQLGQVDTSVSGALGVGSPFTYRASWNSNGVERSKYPGIMSLSSSTNGGWKLTFLHDLGNDGSDSWDPSNIVPAGYAYRKPGGARGWDMRGGWMQQRTTAPISAATYQLDFSGAYFQDLTIAATNITFATTNWDGGSTNVETRIFVIRSGGTIPTLTWPSNFCVIASAAGSALPTNMNPGQMLRLQIESVGTGESNKIVSAGLGTDFTWTWDADAQNFFNRVGAGVLTVAQSNSVNNLVLSAKANGWWTKADAIYPFIGGTSNAHAMNLKSTNFPITWTAAGITHDANGVTGNALTGFGDTGFVPSTAGGNYALNAASVFVYCGTTTPTDFGYFMGAQSTSTTLRTGIRRNGVFATITGINNNNASAPQVNMFGDFRGPILGSRTASTTANVYAVPGTQPDSTATTGLPDTAVYILARNGAGTADNFSAANLRGAMIGGSFSAAEWLLIQADWDAFELANNRKVP